MIKSIKAEGYKSIKKLELELGRVNVFIGENGAGKSNILEVFALAGAAVAGKLDNEFLSSRGVRVTEPDYMRPAFKGIEFSSIGISLTGLESENFSIELSSSSAPYPKWSADVVRIFDSVDLSVLDKVVSEYFNGLDKGGSLSVDGSGFSVNLERQLKSLSIMSELIEDLAFISKTKVEKANNKPRFELRNNSRVADLFSKKFGVPRLCDFAIFSPENSALRIFQREGQIEPLGINGEGLLKLLSVLSREEHGETLQEIKSSLKVLGWFEDFTLVDGDTLSPRRITIKDRYIEENKRYFDQMSANEGFLFLLFYFALFSTNLTPKIFAIDNIDASLNPKLCEKLLHELTKLAKKHDKQVLLTTHNPATLDGLNLDDDEQRLFVVSRSQSGETRVKRLQKKTKSSENDKPIRLSEMFLKGSLGGLPKGF